MTRQPASRLLDIAADLKARKSPDLAACALLALRRIEHLRTKPGYERARHWGVGPAHHILATLGLVTIGTPNAYTLACPVDLTLDGRCVADLLAGATQ